jgi:hypothetical protein
MEAIIKVLLKRMDRKTAHRLARELYCHVQGSKSATETFRRIAEKLEDLDVE